MLYSRRAFATVYRHYRAMLVVAILLTGCSPQGEGPGHRPQALALRPQQELKIGRAAYAELLAEAAILRSGPEFEQVQRVSRRIAEAVEIEPLQREINLHVEDYPFEWEYCVIESQHINAFCLPGGKIGVFTALLRIVQNDDQLAAVLAHEVAHALAHHVNERLARQQMFPAAAALANGNGNVDPSAHHGVVNLLSGLTGLAHDRAQ